MKPRDHETELQRLAQEYSKLPDFQLAELAADSAALTDPARTALKEEIGRRGLNVEFVESQLDAEETEEDELIIIGQYRDLAEAQLARGLLESSGIECFLADDNLVGINWLLSNAVGNVKLQVREADAEAALEILNTPASDTSDTEDAD
jgi:hypothetical protein